MAKTKQLIQIENSVRNAFTRLDASFLYDLDPTWTYSYLDFEGIFADLKFKIEKLKSQGLNSLTVTPSTCKFCYPEGNAYSFLNPQNDKAEIRIVILEENAGNYRIAECKNRPILSTVDGLPF
jgi:hypothetical protein